MSWRRKLTAAGLVLCLGGAAIEGAARLYRSRLGPAPEPLRTAYDPFLGYRLVGGQGVNSQGFRGEPFAVPKTPGTFRIFCVGGSSTFGSGVDAHRAYPAVLQGILRAKSAGPIEVVNAGVPAYTSRQSVANIERRIRRLEPDLIVFLHAYNDLFSNGDPDYVRLAALDGERATFPEPSPLQRLVEHSSALQLVLWWQMGHGQKQKQLDQRSVDAFARNIDRLIGWSARSGVPLLLVTYPSLWPLAARLESASTADDSIPALDVYLHMSRLALPTLVYGLNVYNETLRSIAAERNVPLLDLARRMPESTELYVDPIHFSEAGCERVAHEVARALEENGLCCPGPNRS